MARINVDDQLWSDPRYLALSKKLGEDRSIGAIVRAWKLAQPFWKQGKLVPPTIWAACRFPKQLMEFGAVELREGGIYVMLSEEQFGWLVQRVKAGQGNGMPQGVPNPDSFAPLIGSNESPDLPPQRQSNDPGEMDGTETGQPPLSVRTEREPQSLPPSLLQIHKTKKLKGGPPRGGSVPQLGSLPDGSGTFVLDGGDLAPLPAPPSPTAAFIAAYVSAWQVAHPSKPGFPKARPDVGGKVVGLIDKFLAERPLDEAIALIQVYCQMRDSWFVTKAHDFVTFRENIGKVGEALGNGEEVGPGGTIDWSKIKLTKGGP